MYKINIFDLIGRVPKVSRFLRGPLYRIVVPVSSARIGNLTTDLVVSEDYEAEASSISAAYIRQSPGHSILVL